jgi:L-malate glycosyltransferase
VIPLLVDLETEWRGGQNQFLLLLKGLRERGHAAELLAARGSALGERAAKAGTRVHTISRGMLRLPAAMKIRKLLAEGRFDLIHPNESHALTAAWLARAHSRVPMIISRRVGYPLGKSAVARARFLAAQRIIANSNWVAEQARASGAPLEKIAVVYEGVEIPALPTAELRQRARNGWGVSPDQILLGCVGVFLPDKGQEWIIRALAALHNEFPSCRLLLAGDGPCRKELETLAESLGIADAMIFAGFVKDIENVYAALDVFLLPSLFEALNNSLLAAMAHAIPSIAFQQGGQAEIIQDGISGLLVPPKDTERLASAIRKILHDASLAGSLARAARRRIEENFSAESMVDSTVRIYEEALSGKR